jgi:hypothetical protein
MHILPCSSFRPTHPLSYSFVENVQVYVQDASEVMNIATTLLNAGNSDIIPMDQLLAACARIAAVMGVHYLPFLPAVLPHILKRATEKLDISVTVRNESNAFLT